MSRSFCPGKLGGVEFTYRDVLSHFGVRKFQVTRFTPPAETQRNPTCRAVADCRLATAVPGAAGALGGASCGAAATAAVKPPLATPPACASHAHGRHRLPIGHDTGLARAVRTLHETCARVQSAACRSFTLGGCSAGRKLCFEARADSCVV
jgi:hypothetical protein